MSKGVLPKDANGNHMNGDAYPPIIDKAQEMG